MTGECVQCQVLGAMRGEPWRSLESQMKCERATLLRQSDHSIPALPQLFSHKHASKSRPLKLREERRNATTKLGRWQSSIELWLLTQHHHTMHACSAFLSCRFQFADMDQNVFKELRIQDLPPPEGMKLNELRCAHPAS